MADASVMPLSQDSQHSLKRDHDSFAFEELENLEKPFTVDSQFHGRYESQPAEPQASESSIPTPPVGVDVNKRDPSPSLSRRSSTSTLSDAGSVTPLRASTPVPTCSAPTHAPSPSQSAFAVMNGNIPPPAKKPKLTFQEREQRKIEKEIKDQARAAEREKKDAERKAQAEEKARRDAEKEADRKKREAEKEEKRVAQEAERVAKEERKRKKEEEKRIKEEEKRVKDEEKLRAEEEKKKKERSQKTLNSFFSIPAAAPRRNSVEGRSSMSPAPTNPTLGVPASSPAAPSPGKKGLSTYDKLFPAFFIQNNVTVAPINRFERDEEATEALEHMIDGYLLGDRSPGVQRSFDATSLFHLSSTDNTIRGKRYMSVRDIMTEVNGGSSRPVDLTSDSQNTQIKRTGDLLRKIPMKCLKFAEDVRPAYIGTYTRRPVHGIAKLARNPMRRDLPNTNYDYDSEAEWIEDEDAEELNSEGEEEEEDDEEDMGGFLDDEGDELANSKRMIMQSDLEPISTGLCWEDRHKKSTNVKMIPYRMEFMLDHKMKSIDPLSAEYWHRPTPKKMEPPRVPLNAFKTNSSTMNSSGAKPIKPFFTPASDLMKLDPSTHTQTYPTQGPTTSSKSSKPIKLLPESDMGKFKAAIKENDRLNKVAIVEILKTHFMERTKPQIKATLEMFATRIGKKEADKRWVLNEDVSVGGV